MSDCFRDHVAHFVDGDEGDNLFVDEGFVVTFALSEAKMDRLALVHAVAGMFGFWRRLFKAIGVRLEVASELFYLGLVWYSGFEVDFQLIHLYPDFGHGIRCALLVGHISDGVELTVDIAADLGEWIV